MSARNSSATQPVFEPLTGREREILGLLAQGYSGPEIGERLTISLNSVKTHMQHLYVKLGVNTKRQAVNRAQELGLVTTLASTGPTPAIQPSPAPRHNLSLQINRFFGRETEISQLQDLLAENRLVTLTGSGGVGKTRLSVRLAEALRIHTQSHPVRRLVTFKFLYSHFRQ